MLTIEPHVKKNQTLNYLLDYKGKDCPIKISIDSRNSVKKRNPSYKNYVHLFYDSKNDFYSASDNKTGAKRFLKSIINSFNIKNYKELMLYSNIDFLNVDVLKVSKNQVHVIDLYQHKIAHILMPAADNEWFLNDIYTQQKIQKESLSINTPTIRFIDDKTQYFVTDYVNGKSFEKLTKIYLDEVIIELFNYYSDQKDFKIKSLDKELVKIENKIDFTLESIEFDNAKKLVGKISSLVGIINSNVLNKNNNDIYYIKNVHGDMNYKENVIKNQDGEIYFIDWEMSRSANILYDYFYMLLFELNQVDETEDAMLFNFFQKPKIDNLINMVERLMGIIIKKQNVINYFYLSILDKVLYKLYVFEKKRIKSNKYSDIVSRSKSLEKYLNKIIKVLNKAALDNESLN